MARHIIERSPETKVSLSFPQPCIRNIVLKSSSSFCCIIQPNSRGELKYSYESCIAHNHPISSCMHLFSLPLFVISLYLGHVFNIIFGYMVTVVLCSMQGTLPNPTCACICDSPPNALFSRFNRHHDIPCVEHVQPQSENHRPLRSRRLHRGRRRHLHSIRLVPNRST